VSYAVERGFGVMVCTPSFVITDSGIQKLLLGIYTYSKGNIIGLLLLFKDEGIMQARYLHEVSNIEDLT
jgi:hypothetical protein